MCDDVHVTKHLFFSFIAKYDTLFRSRVRERYRGKTLELTTQQQLATDAYFKPTSVATVKRGQHVPDLLPVRSLTGPA